MVPVQHLLPPAAAASAVALTSPGVAGDGWRGCVDCAPSPPALGMDIRGAAVFQRREGSPGPVLVPCVNRRRVTLCMAPPVGAEGTARDGADGDSSTPALPWALRAIVGALSASLHCRVQGRAAPPGIWWAFQCLVALPGAGAECLVLRVVDIQQEPVEGGHPRGLAAVAVDLMGWYCGEGGPARDPRPPVPHPHRWLLLGAAVACLRRLHVPCAPEPVPVEHLVCAQCAEMDEGGGGFGMSPSTHCLLPLADVVERLAAASYEPTASLACGGRVLHRTPAAQLAPLWLPCDDRTGLALEGEAVRVPHASQGTHHAYTTATALCPFVVTLAHVRTPCKAPASRLLIPLPSLCVGLGAVCAVVGGRPHPQQLAPP
jgi:hypothetical protein